MKNLLAERNRDRLAARISAQTLLAFDFDGCLSPIHRHRDQAGMRRKTRTLLQQLTTLYPSVVISSRARRDVLARVAGIPFREVFGNHGSEPGTDRARLRRDVRRWRPLLEQRLAELRGVDVEDKGLSVSIHYRASLSKRESLAAIRAAAQRLDGVRLIQGKQVLHVLPRGAADKATALRHVRRRLSCDTALYVGDDESDELVFGIPAEWLVGVRIGPARESHAQYFIPRQLDIDRLLAWLIALRS